MAIYDINGNAIVSDGNSPIDGKKILMIGDSNMQYNGATIKSYIEERYGCTFNVKAKAGIGWEYTSWDGETSPRDIDADCGVGYVNEVLDTLGESTIITAYDIIVIMLGTNCWNMGDMADSASDIDTMCGAMRYCMEKLCYYGRQIKIGVVIPMRTDDGAYVYTPSATLEQMPTKFQYVEEIARQYAVPTLNIWNRGRIIANKYTPDGTNYYLSDTVHMGGNGVEQFEQILGSWIAYEL